MIQRYEYESTKISLPAFFISKKRLKQAEIQRQKIIADYASRGWRLVQIIQPFHVETGLQLYYEIIFEREYECTNTNLKTST